MMSDNEFLEIIQGLQEKTSADALKWQSGHSELLKALGTLQDGYRAQLPHAVIDLQYGSPQAEPDFITFTLSRGPGQGTLAQRKVYEGDVGWNQLYDLYALIKRRALGWDDVFQDVRKFLGKTNTPVGTS